MGVKKPERQRSFSFLLSEIPKTLTNIFAEIKKKKTQEWVLPLLKYKSGLKRLRLRSNNVNYYSTV